MSNPSTQYEYRASYLDFVGEISSTAKGALRSLSQKIYDSPEFSGEVGGEVVLQSRPKNPWKVIPVDSDLIHMVEEIKELDGN